MIVSALQFGSTIAARELAACVALDALPKAAEGVWATLSADHRGIGYEQGQQRFERTLGALLAARARITRLEQQVDLYRPSFSGYAVAAPVEAIEAIYREYDLCLDKLVGAIREQAAGGLAGQADQAMALARLHTVQGRVVAEVGQHLRAVQDNLVHATGHLFLRPFEEVQQRRDFISYFLSMKFAYARLFLAQVKAQLLLRLEHDNPFSAYRLGNELKEFDILLTRQDKSMSSRLEQPLVDLVREFSLEKPGLRGGVSVRFWSPLCLRGLRFIGDEGVGSINLNQEWRLEPVQALAVAADLEYQFHLKHAVSGKILQLGQFHNALGCNDYKSVTGTWKVCWDTGLKSFTLQYKCQATDYRNDLYLAAASKSYGIDDIRLGGMIPGHRGDQLTCFHFEPYARAFDDCERLLVDEHLTPGCCLTDKTGAYTLQYRESGELEVIRVRDGKLVWAAGAQTRMRPERLMLHPDGNLVAYDIHGRAYWSSGKYFSDQQAVYRRSELRIRKDGRVEIRVPGQELFWVTPQ